MSLLITAIGVSYFLENGAQLVFGADAKVVPEYFELPNLSIGDVALSANAIITIVVTAVSTIVLTILVQKTKLGKAMRAVSEDMGAARLMGINVNRVISLVFLIGPGLGGVAGIMVGIYYGQIDFLMGWSYGLKAFIAAILGGIGNIPGAMLGGLILGVSEALASAYIAVAWKDVVAFLVLILILIIRPTGLLGERTADKL